MAQAQPDPNANPSPMAPTSAWLQGMPNAPGFTPNYNASTMAMLPAYQKYMAANSGGYDAFKNMAMRRGPSDWANLATTQQDMQAQDQLNKAVQTGGANTAAAEGNLSMQGGLSSGARERAQEAGALSTTGAEQGINRTAGQNKLQIAMNDEQNRMSELGQLPGIEQQKASAWQNVNQADTGNQIMENQSVNSYNQNLYKQQMDAWAAGKQAEATANSGKK